uniref:Uncharacterized protein n=1 Tax=Amphimedon queenslandica TaxID=400682 RepID=A0A1X7SJ34_AMPQE
MSERIAGSPSKRVSKIFSFRTKDQTTPMGKRRRRKDDDEEDDDEIVLPSDPLTTDGPTLQHIGGCRPGH